MCSRMPFFIAALPSREKVFVSSYALQPSLPTIGILTVFDNVEVARCTGWCITICLFFTFGMQRSSSSQVNLVNQSPNLWGDRRAAAKHVVADELESSTVDIHMRFVAELEDAYWRSHFSTQAYYVMGRSYDQYQPALELGWNSALKNPDGCFEDSVAILEVQWSKHSGSSLLPWREVHQAVKEAWKHARIQMQTLQVRQPTLLCSRDVASLLQPLHQHCLVMVAELQRVGGMPLSDFVKQIIERHVYLMQGFARSLYALGAPYGTHDQSASPWMRKLQGRWSKLKLQFTDASPEDFLAVCEQGERNLLSAYQATLGKQLPQDAKEVLEQQAKQLESHVKKLHWVRNNWVIQ